MGDTNTGVTTLKVFHYVSGSPCNSSLMLLLTTSGCLGCWKWEEVNWESYIIVEKQQLAEYMRGSQGMLGRSDSSLVVCCLGALTKLKYGFVESLCHDCWDSTSHLCWCPYPMVWRALETRCIMTYGNLLHITFLGSIKNYLCDNCCLASSVNMAIIPCVS